MSQSLKDAVYIVTGASTGFGFAIAEHLVGRGARVGMVARRAGRLEEAAEKLGTDHCHWIAADVSDSEAIEKAFADIKAHFGRLDGVVNNAGIAMPGRVEKLSMEEVRAQADINFVGTVNCCRVGIPLLEGASNPRIINVSSASACHFDEMVHLSIYASTKAAVERFTRDLRNEMQEYEIGVTLLRPGNADTEFAAGWEPERFIDSVNAWHSMGPWMDTGMECSHVAEAVGFCLGMDPGVSVEELEIRPYRRMDKPKF